VQDWYGAYSPNTQANPKGPGADIGKGKVIRGGSFKTQDSQATTTTRGNAGVDNRGDDIGFRCAK
jgi:formylglycine-generating enzyme required for sulfatase activity